MRNPEDTEEIPGEAAGDPAMDEAVAVTIGLHSQIRPCRPSHARDNLSLPVSLDLSPSLPRCLLIQT